MDKYQYLLFDLDGTLTDPALGITNSVMYALKKFGITPPEREALYSFIGPPLIDSFMEYYSLSAEDAKAAVAYYREYFREIGLLENVKYDGVDEMLSRLKAAGKTLLVATSKPEVFARKILDHFGLTQYFDFIAGALMDETRTRKHEVIAYALESFPVTDKSRAIMIGDRKHDILGAKHEGIASLGVLYGFGDRAEHENAGADYIVENVCDVAGLFGA